MIGAVHRVAILDYRQCLSVELLVLKEEAQAALHNLIISQKYHGKHEGDHCLSEYNIKQEDAPCREWTTLLKFYLVKLKN